MKLSVEMSLLGQSSIIFLALTISQECVKPETSKVEAISKMAIPRNVKGIRSLLGTLNYYWKFGPERAEYLVALNYLLKKGINVTAMSMMEDNIWKCMVQQLTEPVLAFPDLKRLFNITTDAR